MLNLTGAIVGPVQSIYKLVMFLIDSSRQISVVKGSVFQLLGEIVAGRVGKASKLITGALAGSVPLLLSFFVRFVGLGGLSGKIRKAVGKVRKPVDKGVNSAVDWIAEKGQTLWDRTGKTAGRISKKVKTWWQIRKRFKLRNGEEHTLYFKARGKQAVLMMASTPIEVEEFLRKNKKKLEKADKKLYYEALMLVEHIRELEQSRNEKKNIGVLYEKISTLMIRLKDIISFIASNNIPKWKSRRSFQDGDTGLKYHARRHSNLSPEEYLKRGQENVMSGKPIKGGGKYPDVNYHIRKVGGDIFSMTITDKKGDILSIDTWQHGEIPMTQTDIIKGLEKSGVTPTKGLWEKM